MASLAWIGGGRASSARSSGNEGDEDMALSNWARLCARNSGGGIPLS